MNNVTNLSGNGHDRAAVAQVDGEQIGRFARALADSGFTPAYARRNAETGAPQDRALWAATAGAMDRLNAGGAGEAANGSESHV